MVAEVMHFGALLSAGVGLQCTVGARRDDALRWIPAAIMLLAMADIALGTALLAPIVWVAVMLGVAVWLAVRVRLAPANDGASRHARVMWLHHACALVVMAGLTGAMGAAATPSGDAHHGASGGILTGLALAGSLAFVGFTAWVIVRVVRRPQRAMLATIEAGSMVAMVGAMALAAVL